MLIDYLAVRLDGPAAAGRQLDLTLRVVDRGEVHAVGLANGALHHTAGRAATDPDATVSLEWAELVALANGGATLDALLERDAVRIEGRREAVDELLSLLVRFELWFPIVTP